jgi:hypothetical protein
MTLRRSSKTTLRGALLSLSLALTGCFGGVTTSDQPIEAVSSTPTVVSIVFPEYRTAPFLLCETSVFNVIRTSTVQGDLFAWSPGSDRLAFIASNSASQWNLGDLTAVPLPAGSPPVILAGNAVGNLSWSPNGSYLAFVSLRTADGVYTLQVVPPEGGETVDFFPGQTAKTDAWASPKIVRQWTDDLHLTGWSSCGVICAQPVELDISQKIQQAAGDPIRSVVDFWEVHRNEPFPPPADIQDAREVNWSPDLSRAVYFDNRDNVWVVSPGTQTQYRIPLPEWDLPYESKWSPDGRFLAVRAGFFLHVYDSLCP